MFRVIIDNDIYTTKFVRFSDGAFSLAIKALPTHADRIQIGIDPKLGSEGLIVLLQALEILEDHFFPEQCPPVSIYIPYLPYARADRVFEDGQVNQLSWAMQQVVAKDIQFTFYVEDLHSTVEVGYRNELYNRTQLQCLLETVQGNELNIDGVIAPDKGAVPKAKEIANHFKVPLFIATKERNPETGKIMAIEAPEGLEAGKTYLVPDDIGDGMGTVAALTSKMPVSSKKIIYLTHGIFSNGLACLMWVDQLLVKNIIGNYVTREEVSKFNEQRRNMEI
jgi:phosphoribosylpyrophosphate synthetase